jgi:hypothetical protein
VEYRSSELEYWSTGVLVKTISTHYSSTPLFFNPETSLSPHQFLTTPASGDQSGALNNI